MKLTVKQVAQMHKITIKTLHHYDSIGLLHPSGKSHVRYRYYNNDDMRKLELILLLKSLGMSLNEIKELFAHPEQISKALEEQSEKNTTDINDYQELFTQCEEKYFLLKTNPKSATQLIGTGNYDDPIIRIMKRKPQDWWEENYPREIESFSIQKYYVASFFPFYKWMLFIFITFMTFILLQPGFTPFPIAIIVSFVSYILLLCIIIIDQTENRKISEQSMVNAMNKFDAILERNKSEQVIVENTQDIPLRTITEFAKINHIKVKTLHYYDEIGLLKPAERNEKDHRLYGATEQLRLDKIINLKFYGFSLETIQKLLNYPDNQSLIHAFEVQIKFIKLNLENLKEQQKQLQSIIVAHQNKPIFIEEIEQNPPGKTKKYRLLIIPLVILLFMPLFFPRINLLPFLYYLILIFPTYLLYKTLKEKA